MRGVLLFVHANSVQRLRCFHRIRDLVGLLSTATHIRNTTLHPDRGTRLHVQGHVWGVRGTIEGLNQRDQLEAIRDAFAILKGEINAQLNRSPGRLITITRTSCMVTGCTIEVELF